MSKVEDLSRQYVLPFLDEIYEVYGEHRQMQLSKFDGYDMMSAYEEGYHQAEKDLRDISWIKEISGVKEMSRAKEEALKAYPPQSIAANYDTINRRDAFEYGYLKAEKDMELTWEDIDILLKISPLVDEQHCDNNREFCEEVFKRFKETKEHGKI